MGVTDTCCICNTSGLAGTGVETASLRSNVRPFHTRQFSVWRCPACRSIHAADEVDLDEAYRPYPFFGQKLDFILRCGYRRLTRRLRRAGLRPGQRVLDFGCGSGLLVQYLREKGCDAAGYDPYSPDHGDPARLAEQYDAVVAQDVIEHDETPLAVLERLDGLAGPGALIAIGTPNAAGIDLARAGRYVHALHQPYHRHILALPALLDAGRHIGWRVERTYLTPYTNMPVLSLPLLHYYMRCFDGTINTLFERPMNSARLWLSPETAFYLIFGYWLCDDADIVAIFRKPTA
ncbi:MAG: class I SAM-dependent methyltransferase [Phycisphaerae bacterium]|nr:class I SAM-dependent methyltransferase [Phycisphaerae bacterium]